MLYDDMEFGYYTEAEKKARQAYEHYEDGNLSQALNELETALELNPSNGSWHFNKALTLDSAGRFEAAIKEYEIALQLNPNDLETLNSLGVDYTRVGYYDMAIDIFKYIEELDPGYEPCYCNRIITYTEMEEHQKAEEMFYLAQQINPDCPLCFYNIGNSLFVRGNYKKAVHCWQKTSELEPGHPEINYRIAQAYWAQGEYDKARRHFLSELRSNPGEVDVIFDFGLLLLETGEPESAKEKFERILELNPGHGLSLFYLGEIAFNKGNYSRAGRLYEKSLRKGRYTPELIGPNFRLAQLALLRGQKMQAREHLLAELNKSPDNADVLVSMGSLFLQIGDYDYSVHSLLRAADIDCNNGTCYYYLGLISALRGRVDEALEFLDNCLALNPSEPSALRDSAALLLEAGELETAGHRLRKARAAGAFEQDLISLERKIKAARLRRKIIEMLSNIEFTTLRRTAKKLSRLFRRH